MELITIVLIDLPTVLSDIVKAVILAHRDVRLLGAFSGVTQDALDASRSADVAILGDVDSGDDVLPEIAWQLLEGRPRMTVLSIADDGRRGVLYELHPTRRELPDLSPSSLMSAIGSVRS